MENCQYVSLYCDIKLSELLLIRIWFICAWQWLALVVNLLRVGKVTTVGGAKVLERDVALVTAQTCPRLPVQGV